MADGHRLQAEVLRTRTVAAIRKGAVASGCAVAAWVDHARTDNLVAVLALETLGTLDETKLNKKLVLMLLIFNFMSIFLSGMLDIYSVASGQSWNQKDQ